MSYIIHKQQMQQPQQAAFHPGNFVGAPAEFVNDLRRIIAEQLEWYFR